MNDVEYPALDWLETIDEYNKQVGYAAYTDPKLPHFDLYELFVQNGWDTEQTANEFAVERESVLRALKV